MIRVLFFFLITFSLYGAPTRKLESITYQSEQGNTIALVQLDDGSTWNWFPDVYSEHFLRKWEKGDEIIIQTNHRPGFILHNPKQPHFDPTVALAFNSYDLFPLITEIDNCCIKLSNETSWQIIYDFSRRTLHYWAPKDRIILIKGAGKNFELININIPHNNPSKIERYIEVEQSCSDMCILESLRD